MSAVRLKTVPVLLLALGAAAHSCTDVDVVAPATGSLEVTTKTIGFEQDPDGYTVQLDGGAPQDIGTNGRVEYTELAPGEHTVDLGGIAAHCRLSVGNSRQTVSVPPGGNASVSFALTCSATVG